MPKTESGFQGRLIQEIRELFPGCVILKNDPNYLQGVPDLIILFGKYWAALECKADISSKHQPNQDHYVEYMDEMSYAAFVYPDNKEQVLHELQSTLRPHRQARISQCQ